MQNMMPQAAKPYNTKSQFGKGGKGKSKGTKKTSKTTKGQQKGSGGKKGSKSKSSKAGGKGAHVGGGHVGPILPTTKPQGATNVTDTQRAQIKAIGKTLTKMRKKQSILMQQIAPTVEAKTASATETEPQVTPSPTLDERIDAPLEASISKGKKWGKSKKAATNIQEAQPMAEATPGRRRKRRGGPPTILRSHEEESHETTPAHTPAPSRPGSPPRQDAQGDAVMADPGVPPRANMVTTATIFSPSGVTNTGWLTEVIPRSVAKKIEWITINLLHKLQDGSATREAVVLATSGMSQWATQMSHTESDDEPEGPAAQGTGSRSSTDLAPAPLASPVNVLGEDNCL